MKKQILLRAGLLALLYGAAFFALSLVQWVRYDSFSRKAGNAVVSGAYARDADGRVVRERATEHGDEYLLSGGARVVFKGMEFAFRAGAGAARCVGVDGAESAVFPVSALVNPEYIRVRLETEDDFFPKGIELNFYPHSEEGFEELLISSVLPEPVREIVVPFRPLRKAEGRADGGLSVYAEGRLWGFDRPVGAEDGAFVLSHQKPLVAYRRRDGAPFNPAEFIAGGMMEKSRYDEILGAWKSKIYALWAAQVSESRNEALIAAYVAESASRRLFAQALERLPAEFAAGAGRTYLSAPFMGRLPQALRSKADFEKANRERLAALLKTDPEAFLMEDKVFVYLAQRGYTALFDEAIRYITNMPPGAPDPKLLPAFFEGWWAWNIWHPKEENPFEGPVYEARRVVAETIRKGHERGGVFVTDRRAVDVPANARLGNAITVYGESSGNNEWAALGRSIVLSCLASADDAGRMPAALVEEGGEFVVPEDAGLVDPLRIWLLIAVSDYYPHAVGVGSLVKGAWVWTMSPSIGASLEGNVLDFGVNFLPGATHYMLISGIRPFSKIQMQDVDYRSDPQFENWDASGWVYSPSEQTLLVKLVHRRHIEHVKIFF